MKKLIKSWRRDVRGTTAIEYGLIAAAIAMVIIGTVFTFGATLNAMFSPLLDWFAD